MHRHTLPPTQFARSGDVSIAYQVFGGGPVDLVFVSGIVYHLEAAHELPGVTDFFRRLSRFSRAVVFDKRGQGCRTAFRSRPAWTSAPTTFAP